MTDDGFIRMMYSGLKDIENLYSVSVNIYGNEDIFENGKNMGILSDDDEEIYNRKYRSDNLSDYLKLRIKNNMGDINILTDSEANDFYSEFDGYSKENLKKYGRFNIRIWLIGDNYPIAYHVKANFGTFLNNNLWSDEYLGYSNSNNIKKVSKEIINKIVEGVSITYLKVKGEM